MIETLSLEEERFRQTLDKGLKLLYEEAKKVKDLLPGEIAFKLYDTYGFPLDLTQDVLKAEGKAVDLTGFQDAMVRQKEEARASWAGSGESKTDPLWFEIRERLSSTEFLGYKVTSAEGVTLALVKEGKEVSSIKAGDKVSLIVNQTPFYGESGGQVGDTGVITTSLGQIQVEDTVRKLGDLIVHIGKVTKGEFKVGDSVHLTVDAGEKDPSQVQPFGNPSFAQSAS